MRLTTLPHGDRCGAAETTPLKALPDGQWATAEAHRSTGGVATVGDRQPWSGAWESRSEQRIRAD